MKNKRPTKVMHIRMPQDLYDKISKYAEAEGRSNSNFAALLLEIAMKDYEKNNKK